MKLPMTARFEVVPEAQEAGGHQRAAAHHSQLLNVDIPSPCVLELVFRIRREVPVEYTCQQPIAVDALKIFTFSQISTARCTTLSTFSNSGHMPKHVPRDRKSVV